MNEPECWLDIVFGLNRLKLEIFISSFNNCEDGDECFEEER